MAAHSKRSHRPNTAWDSQAAWYDRLVGEDGSSYHKEVVLPKTIDLLAPKAGESILDLGCGQGVLCRLLKASSVNPTGVDLSKDLIDRAKNYDTKHISYFVDDATNLSAQFRKKQFDAAVSVLALGNMQSMAGFFESAFDAVKSNGRLVFVIMHPCFRIPRQSHWQYDEAKKLQYRRIDRYLTPMPIPILTHPGKNDSAYSMMFHRPLHEIISSAAQAGWLINAVEEWTSNKTSSGVKAKAENRARNEIPLFLAIAAIKQ